MLLIRDEQMRVFREQSKDNFRDRLARHLNLDETETSAALALAARFHMQRESDIVRFSELLLQHFGKLNGIRIAKPLQNILLAYGVPAEVRLTRFTAAL